MPEESPPAAGYTGLAVYLAAQPGPDLTLSFDEIEAIIGTPLPLLARLLAHWWRAHPSTPAHHGGTWQAVGWRVERLDPSAGTVTFARTDDGVPDACSGP